MLRVIGRQRLVDRAFGWYLDKAHPSFATPAAAAARACDESPALLESGGMEIAFDERGLVPVRHPGLAHAARC